MLDLQVWCNVNLLLESIVRNVVLECLAINHMVGHGRHLFIKTNHLCSENYFRLELIKACMRFDVFEFSKGI